MATMDAPVERSVSYILLESIKQKIEAHPKVTGCSLYDSREGITHFDIEYSINGCNHRPLRDLIFLRIADGFRVTTNSIRETFTTLSLPLNHPNPAEPIFDHINTLINSHYV